MKTTLWTLAFCIAFGASAANAQPGPPPQDPAERAERAKQMRDQRRDDAHQRREQHQQLRDERRDSGERPAGDRVRVQPRDSAMPRVQPLDEATRRQLAERRRTAPIDPQAAMNRHLRRMDNEHNRRLAQIARIRELAAQSKDAQLIEQVDALAKREEVAYLASKERLQARLAQRQSVRPGPGMEVDTPKQRPERLVAPGSPPDRAVNPAP